MFGKSIKKALGIQAKTRVKGVGSRTYHHVLPPLPAARQAFEEYIGQPVSWDEDGEEEIIEMRRASKGRSNQTGT